MLALQIEFKGSRLEFKPTPELGSSKNKMLHVVYRVGNMDRAIKFYQDVFGMEVCLVILSAVVGSCCGWCRCCCCWSLGWFGKGVVVGWIVTGTY